MGETSVESNGGSICFCRVAIVGSHRVRVAKVVSLLHQQSQELDLGSYKIKIEYLPCVATFDSYENEHGQRTEYLAKVDYHGVDGSQLKGSSIAPFFDMDQAPDIDAENDKSLTKDGSNNNAKRLSFPGVAAVAIGCGIESKQHVDMISSFCNSLNAGPASQIRVECVTPNPEYPSMKEENDAYKKLDADTKAEAIRLQTSGPGKMAKFAQQVAHETINAAREQSKGKEKSNSSSLCNDGVDRGEQSVSERAEAQESQTEEVNVHQEPDPDKARYACRMCRTVLLGEDDLEDPPHARMKHSFSRRKHGRSDVGNSAVCGSLFLAKELDWMGDIGAMEGRFSCPHCSAKVGTWKWAGAQCSCGTWVTPAIQIPLSKVDTLVPKSETLPPGTVISPHALISPINIADLHITNPQSFTGS